jgi:Tfp pilus assembly protein PilF
MPGCNCDDSERSMTNVVLASRVWIVGLALAAATSGCAGWMPRKAEQPTLSQTRQERHREAVQAFEQQRDQAQLETALARWQQGDLGGCEARLRSLVARRPDFCDAHLQLAELAWSCENAEEAEAEYRAALQLAPERADVNHALGLLLQATGRPDEAEQLLVRARDLEPANELFQSAASPTGVIPATAVSALPGVRATP